MSDPKPLARIALYIVAAALLLAAPFLIDALLGRTWVRIVDVALLFIMLALGLNIVVGYAGLLDLGYIAFFAVGAYCYALLASPQFDIHWSFLVLLAARRAGRRGVRRAARRAHPAAARRLSRDRHTRLRRDHPDLSEQPEPPVQHHQRAAGHHADRPVADRRS